MTDAPNERPKKTETIEVRVPHEVKTELKRRADADKTTISEIVRGFIAQYLKSGAPTEQKQRVPLAWLGSSIVAVIVLGLGSSMLATANTISLKLDGAFRDTNGESYRSAIFSSPIRVSPGEEQSIVVGDEDFRISLVVTETPDDMYYIRMAIFDDTALESEPVATPGIIIKKDSVGTIDITSQPGKSYLMTVEVGGD